MAVTHFVILESLTILLRKAVIGRVGQTANTIMVMLILLLL